MVQRPRDMSASVEMYAQGEENDDPRCIVVFRQSDAERIAEALKYYSAAIYADRTDERARFETLRTMLLEQFDPEHPGGVLTWPDDAA